MENHPFQELFQTHKKCACRLKKTSCQERVAKLVALKKWIHSQKVSIREAAYSDLSKPFTEVDISEISVILQEISHALKYLKQWMKPKKVKAPLPLVGTKGYIHYEPLGTSLIISPWNYPFNLAVGPLVSAIAAGCTVVLKPSELAPATSALLKKMVRELFPPDEIAVVEGGKEVVQQLLLLPFDKLFFTGSPATGKIMLKAAAQHHMEVTLELGGKSPVLIDRGYSPRDAAQKIAWAKWLNCGQTCIAPDYVLVNDEVYDLFKQILVDTVHQMFPSKRKDISECLDYGRIINSEHHRRLQLLLEDARNKGAKCLMGGDFDLESKYFAPTILEGVVADMDIMKFEIFGPIDEIEPVLTVVRA
jgi:aldehyde dehydrogenase (NAD+)